MSDIKKQDKENFLEKIRLQDYNFHNIKCSNCSDEIEISKYGATYIFGGNGVGKTTISKNIFDSRSDMFHYFTYEENSDLVNGQLIVSKNEKNINNANEKLLYINALIVQKIDSLLKKINLSLGSNLFKYLIKNKKKLILKDDWIIPKNRNLDINFLNLEILNKIKNNLVKKSDYNYLIDLIKKYENIKKEDLINLEELTSIFCKQKKYFEDNTNKLKEFLDENNFFLKKEEIYKIVKDINYLEKCILCNQKIKSWESIKNEIELKIDQFKKLFLKDNDLEKITNIIKNFSKTFKRQLDFEKKNYDIDLINFMINNINDFDCNSQKLFHELNEIIRLLDAEISEIFMNKFEESNLIEFLIDTLKDIHEWEKEKIINNKIINEYQLVISFIEEKIGKGRISIDENESKIIINNNKVTKSDELKEYLSTGEKKFITFCFSLIFFIIKNERKTIIIDDPFSSYDTENEYNIIYLINHLINSKKISFLILTHSWQFISSQAMTSMIADRERRDYFYVLEKSFFNGNNTTFFLKKLCEMSNKENIEINKYFSNKYFIHWIRKENEIFIKKNINFENQINEYQNFIFSILPIIRSYLSFTRNSIPECLNKLMHYYDENMSINDIDDDIDIFVKKLFEFFNLDKEKIDELKIDENSIMEMYKKIIKNILLFKINEDIFKFDLYLGLSDTMISEQLKKLALILYLRKYLEKVLIEKINKNNIKYDENISNNNFNIFNLVKKCEIMKIITNEEALLLKSKRIFINCFSHLERLNNYLIPLFELDNNFIENTFKFIEEFKNKDN